MCIRWHVRTHHVRELRVGQTIFVLSQHCNNHSQVQVYSISILLMGWINYVIVHIQSGNRIERFSASAWEQRKEWNTRTFDQLQSWACFYPLKTYTVTIQSSPWIFELLSAAARQTVWHCKQHTLDPIATTISLIYSTCRMMQSEQTVYSSMNFTKNFIFELNCISTSSFEQ